jgi:hypothetical protein
MATIANHTVLRSDDNRVSTSRCEFSDKTEYVDISLHCEELNLQQDTNTLMVDGRRVKVKTVTAKDDEGNKVSLTIYFK